MVVVNVSPRELGGQGRDRRVNLEFDECAFEFRVGDDLGTGVAPSIPQAYAECTHQLPKVVVDVRFADGLEAMDNVNCQPKAAA